MKKKDLGRYKRQHTEIRKQIEFTPKEFHNPYKSAGKIDPPAEAKKKKIRKLMARRIAPDEKPYTWSMGYNYLCGRWTQGGKYAQLSGSSLNRQLSLYERSQDIDKELARVTDHLIKVARKMSIKLREKYGERGYSQIRRKFCRLAMRQDTETAREFELWLRSLEVGELYDYSLGIHMLSARSRGKIKDKATAFYRACPGSRVFCTLTFVDAVDDRTGVAILNKFLTQARKKFPGFQYFWVAERQKKNPDFPGNIHFHMILNRRLPVGRWNAMWIMQQYNAGLRGKDKYGSQVPYEEIKQAYDLDMQEGFAKKRLQKIFNPLDIRRVRSIGQLSNYLTKYITKQDRDEPFMCAVWHCSRRVSRLFVRQTAGPSAFAYMKSFENVRLDPSTGECWVPQEVRGDFWVIIYANNKKAPLRFLRMMEQVNKWIINGIELTGRDIPTINDDEYRRSYCREDADWG
jgi:hypothetical protein